jgi:mRNA interferase RelE/StbE
MKTVAYTREALAGLRKHRSDAAAIMAKVTRYAETSVGDVKALTGRSGKRLRCGDYRVIFEETETEIRVLAVGPRGDIYK